MADITGNLILIDRKGYYKENNSPIKEDHITFDWDNGTYYIGKLALDEGIKRVRHFFGDEPILELKHLNIAYSEEEFTHIENKDDDKTSK